jgi:signal transduction histidine kinase
MKDEEQSVRLAQELASAVRDQYAHQAHTIIIGDESHLGFYTEAERRVLELTRLLRSRTSSAEARAWVDDIDAASAELDGIFRRSIVPAVLRGDRALVQSEHARAQEVVTRIQDRTEQLVEAFEAGIAASRAEVDAVERRTFRWLVALLVGAPILAAAVSLYIGRSIARPVATLQEGARRLAAGRLDTRIEIDTPDEFGTLARQFNAMTASLEEHQEKLVESEKLAGIGRLAAGVAHEINNPLAVILGYTRLLGKKASGSLAEDLRIIEDEAIRARDIVEGLLDLSRPLPPSRERVDLRATCDEVVSRLREAGVLTGVTVDVEGTGTVPGHPAKLRQVVLNLVRNAAEAAGPDGTVRVGVSGDGASVRVAVVDSGPGLDPAAEGRLFEPFFTTKDRGTGLGLALSRAIARAHGGDVEAASAPGGGAVFTLRLPTSAAQEAP